MTTAHDYLRRLSPEYYQGEAWVHWTMTMDHRGTGWLTESFHLRFREILTHSAFRYEFACPIYCLMPDHMHLLWHGIARETNQLHAMKHFRKELNVVLRSSGYQLQKQAYDHVLREHEQEREAIEEVITYIARNPERKGLVAPDKFAEYPYTSCLIPGYPSFRLFLQDSWDRLWRTIAYLKKLKSKT